MSVVASPIKEQAELVTPLVGPCVQLEQDSVVGRLTNVLSHKTRDN